MAAGESKKPQAFAYVDAYNLYYGLRKSCGRGVAGWRWLDLPALLRRMAPEFEIARVYYFTAHIQPPNWAKAKRQKRLLRALATFPEVVPVFGRYRSDPAEFPTVANPDVSVEVLRTEEKETDVNIAVQLLVDGLLERNVENLLVVSNDSDQVPPIRLLRQAGLTVGVLNPHVDRPSAQLKKEATWMRTIRPSNVLATQLPEEMHDAAGSFTKPSN